MAARKQSPRIFYGWRILAAAFPLLMVVHGVTMRSYGLFFDPLQREFGWSHALIALAFSLDRVEGGLLAPVTGYMTDRLGGRKMMLMGTLIIGLGFLLASQIHSLWQFYAAFLLINTGCSIGAYSTLQAVIVRWFDRYLGRAFGVLNMAPPIAAIFLPIIATIITVWGWRAALVFAGGAVLTISFPLSFFIRSRPEDYGLLPDGAVADESTLPSPRPQGAHPTRGSTRRGEAVSIAQALRTPAFWLIGISFAMFNLSHQAERLLIIPHLQARGFSRELASVTVTIGFLVIGPPTRFLMGWVADHVNVKSTYPLVFLLQALGLFFLANLTSAWQVIAFALVYETAFSANLAFQGVLIVHSFGTHRFASIRGLMQTLGILAAVIGPVLGGAMFDVSGTYSLFFTLMSGVALLGIPPIMLAKPVTWERQ